MKPYEDCTVFGPYERKDGRSHVVIEDTDGNRKVVSYPRYLVEVELGRTLEPDEDVHHIDENFKNNILSNLRVWKKSDHLKFHKTKKKK